VLLKFLIDEAHPSGVLVHGGKSTRRLAKVMQWPLTVGSTADISDKCVVSIGHLGDRGYISGDVRDHLARLAGRKLSACTRTVKVREKYKSEQ